VTPDAPLPGTKAETAGRRVVRCALCGRPLVAAEARRWGLGPECRHKLNPAPTVRRPGRFDVEQEALPGV
jgi:hypothetical protein